MKALIFAAGLGTRLYPLTENKPKALVEINGKTLLEIQIKRLISFGISDVIINIHHFGDLIINFLNANQNFNINIQISDERDLLLDTGGGLKKAAHFFDDNQPFLVHNVDVLSDIDFNQLIAFHTKNNSLATLAVRKRETQRYFLFDSSMKLSGWQNTKTQEVKLRTNQELNALSQFAFSGIHVISPAIFNLIHQEGAFSITNTYLELAEKNTIMGFDHSDSKWMDVGRIEHLEIAKTKFDI